MRIDSLEDWRDASPFSVGGPGEVVRCKFDVSCSGFCAVFADGIPIGTGAMFSCEFSASEGPVLVTFEADEGCSVALRLRQGVPVLPPSEEASLTRIAPRESSESREMRRVIQAMNRNAERREAGLREEFRRLIAERDVQVIE